MTGKLKKYYDVADQLEFDRWVHPNGEPFGGWRANVKGTNIWVAHVPSTDVGRCCVEAFFADHWRQREFPAFHQGKPRKQWEMHESTGFHSLFPKEDERQKMLICMAWYDMQDEFRAAV